MRQALPSRRSPGVLLKEIDHQRRTRSRTAMPLSGVDTDLHTVPSLPERNGAQNFDPTLNESTKITFVVTAQFADYDLIFASFC